MMVADAQAREEGKKEKRRKVKRSSEARDSFC